MPGVGSYPYEPGCPDAGDRFCFTAAMARHKSEWWQQRLAEVDEGTEIEDVARQHGVRAKTLSWWRTELKRRARKRTGPRLLPVVLATPRPTSGAVEVLVEVGAARMHLKGAVSAEYRRPAAPTRRWRNRRDHSHRQPVWREQLSRDEYDPQDQAVPSHVKSTE
jgi:transposase-like protein